MNRLKLTKVASSILHYAVLFGLVLVFRAGLDRFYQQYPDVHVLVSSAGRSTARLIPITAVMIVLYYLARCIQAFIAGLRDSDSNHAYPCDPADPQVDGGLAR